MQEHRLEENVENLGQQENVQEIGGVDFQADENLFRLFGLVG